MKRTSKSIKNAAKTMKNTSKYIKSAPKCIEIAPKAGKNGGIDFFWCQKPTFWGEISLFFLIWFPVKNGCKGAP